MTNFVKAYNNSGKITDWVDLDQATGFFLSFERAGTTRIMAKINNNDYAIAVFLGNSSETEELASFWVNSIADSQSARKVKPLAEWIPEENFDFAYVALSQIYLLSKRTDNAVILVKALNKTNLETGKADYLEATRERAREFYNDNVAHSFNIEEGSTTTKA